MSTCCSILLCPICEEPLTDNPRSVYCSRGHQFDRAREGYVNLLYFKGRRPQTLGDSMQMVRARHRFLSAGYYDPLVVALATTTLRQQAGGDTAKALYILDAGCGTGYFLKAVCDAHRAESTNSVCGYGLDLSKEAVRIAARAYPMATFFVADVNKRLLFPDGTIDILLNVFAPRNVVEFARILRPRGQAFVVIPAPDHLYGLRSRLPLLGIQEDKRSQVIDQFNRWFELESEEAITFTLHLNASALSDLLKMTPNYWHLDQSTWQELEEMSGGDVLASFMLLQFRRMEQSAAEPTHKQQRGDEPN